MSRNVSLGGDRLGSGAKMNVHLHGYERSNHDLDYIWKSTMAPGTLVPFMSKVLLPGDTMEIDLNTKVMTHPTLGPLFGSFKVQLDLFQIPVRLYVGALHNSRTKIGMNMSNIKMPVLEMEAFWNPAAPDLDNSQVNPSALIRYLGVSGLGRRSAANAEVTRRVNAIPYLGYYDIYKQYYANKQEERGYIIHTEPVAIVKTVTQVGGSWGSALLPQSPLYGEQRLQRSTMVTISYSGSTPVMSQIIFYTSNGDMSAPQLFGVIRQNGSTFELLQPTVNMADPGFYIYNWRYQEASDAVDKEPVLLSFPLVNIDNMRDTLAANTGIGTPYVIGNGAIAPYGSSMRKVSGIFSKMYSQEGLAIKTYQSDLFNNWLNDEWIDGTGGVNDISKISTAGGSFTIESLVLANKVYNMFNRIAVTDGTYQAYINAAYDHELYGLAQHPTYEGGLSKELEFEEVVSMSESGNQPLATLGGKGVMGQKHKGGRATIKANEIGWMMGIVSLTPRIDYSQGNEWDINLFSIGDFHVPGLDQIGFQDLNADQLHWTSTSITTGVTTFTAVGKQPAWINYMTSVNKTFGNFAVKGNEMFMTLNRNYNGGSTGITDLTTYIDPVKYNQIFAETARDAMNFWVQIRIGISARRKMSAKIMPNL